MIKINRENFSMESEICFFDLCVPKNFMSLNTLDKFFSSIFEKYFSLLKSKYGFVNSENFLKGLHRYKINSNRPLLDFDNLEIVFDKYGKDILPIFKKWEIINRSHIMREELKLEVVDSREYNFLIDSMFLSELMYSIAFEINEILKLRDGRKEPKIDVKIGNDSSLGLLDRLEISQMTILVLSRELSLAYEMFLRGEIE